MILITKPEVKRCSFGWHHFRKHCYEQKSFRVWRYIAATQECTKHTLISEHRQLRWQYWKHNLFGAMRKFSLSKCKKKKTTHVLHHRNSMGSDEQQITYQTAREIMWLDWDYRNRNEKWDFLGINLSEHLHQRNVYLYFCAFTQSLVRVMLAGLETTEEKGGNLIHEQHNLGARSNSYYTRSWQLARVKINDNLQKYSNDHYLELKNEAIATSVWWMDWLPCSRLMKQFDISSRHFSFHWHIPNHSYNGLGGSGVKPFRIILFRGGTQMEVSGPFKRKKYYLQYISATDNNGHLGAGKHSFMLDVIES